MKPTIIRSFDSVWTPSPTALAVQAGAARSGVRLSTFLPDDVIAEMLAIEEAEAQGASLLALENSKPTAGAN